MLLNDRHARMSIRRAPCMECGGVLPRVGVKQVMPVTVEAVTHPGRAPLHVKSVAGCDPLRFRDRQRGGDEQVDVVVVDLRGCTGQLLQRGGLELADPLVAAAEFGGEAVVGPPCRREGARGEDQPPPFLQFIEQIPGRLVQIAVRFVPLPFGVQGQPQPSTAVVSTALANRSLTPSPSRLFRRCGTPSPGRTARHDQLLPRR